jgi:transcriptional regulator with XRE-family HTH domain
MREASGIDRAELVGAGIRRARVKAGFTQFDLARLAGIGTLSVRRLEQGRVGRPRAETLERIASACGCTIDDLKPSNLDDLVAAE